MVLKRTATGEGDKDIGFHAQVAGKDALVDVLCSFLRLPWDRVDLLQDGDVIGFSVVKVDGQERNSVRGKLVVDPGEGWHLACTRC